MEINREERTFIMVKPDGVQRSLSGEIIKRFEQRGYKLIALKMVSPSKEHFEKHYQHLSSKKFFPDLVSYMCSGPVVASIWQGTQAVKVGRKIVGETDPIESNPGTVRGDFCIEKGRNIVHASDTVDNAEKEIALWFSKEEIQSWKKTDEKNVFEIS